MTRRHAVEAPPRRWTRYLILVPAFLVFLLGAAIYGGTSVTCTRAEGPAACRVVESRAMGTFGLADYTLQDVKDAKADTYEYKSTEKVDGKTRNVTRTGYQLVLVLAGRESRAFSSSEGRVSESAEALHEFLTDSEPGQVTVKEGNHFSWAAFAFGGLWLLVATAILRSQR